MLLPVLRSSQLASPFLDRLPSAEVCGPLRVTLARQLVLDNGRQQLKWQIERDLRGGPGFAALMPEALENLRQGLRVDVHDTEAGRMLALLRVDGGPAAAAVMLDDLWEVAVEHLGGSGDLLLGIPTDFEVMVCRASDPIADTLRAAVEGAGADPVSEWTVPTVLRLGPGGLSPAS